MFHLTTGINHLSSHDTYDEAYYEALAIMSPGNMEDVVIWRCDQVVAVLRDNGETYGIQRIELMRVPIGEPVNA